MGLGAAYESGVRDRTGGGFGVGSTRYDNLAGQLGPLSYELAVIMRPPILENIFGDA